jgi:hypothetical protein
MGNSLGIKVFNGGDQALEKWSANLRPESALLSEMLEKLSTFCKLHNKQRSGLNWLTGHFNFSLFNSFDNVDEMSVMKFFEEIIFPLEGVNFALSLQINLDCEKLIFLSSEIDAKLLSMYTLLDLRLRGGSESDSHQQSCILMLKVPFFDDVQIKMIMNITNYERIKYDLCTHRSTEFLLNIN